MKPTEGVIPRSVLRQIEAVVAAVDDSDITSMEVEHGAFKLSLRRPAGVRAVARAVPEVTEPGPLLPLEPLIVPITSELVGRFMLPHPVRRGDQVAAGDIVACIESMSLRNDVRAPVAGRIVEILVEPGHPVEYGQMLMALVPAAESGSPGGGGGERG